MTKPASIHEFPACIRFGISFSNTELPTFNDGKTILLGGGVATFGKDFGEKVNAVEYQLNTDKERKIYSGNELYALYKDLSKDDLIHDLTSYGYFKTDVTYYMKPIKHLNNTMPLEKYDQDIERIDIGDSCLSRDDGFFIDHLRMKAEGNSLDSKIYYEIAKDLVKENVITKPSLEHSPDMLVKAISVGVLSRDKNFPDTYKKLLQDESKKEYALGDLWKKDSLEIVRELGMEYSSWMYRYPKVSKEVLALPAEKFESRRWEDVLDDSMKSVVDLGKLEIFVDKGYINHEILKDDVKHVLPEIEDLAIKYNEKYKEIGVFRGYDFDTEFRYKDYLASKEILNTISNSENTKTLSPNPIDRIGVKIDLEGASHYYEKCCNKSDEYKEYKELKEKTVASKEEKDAPVKKINKKVLPKKAKDTEIKKDPLPAGATYPQYEEPVIIDKPKKKELGAKISAPKKERGITTQRKNGITGGR